MSEAVGSRPEDRRVVRYIIVAHGMGAPKQNQTVLEVVHRFAEARRAEAESPYGPVTLGLATSQTGASFSASRRWRFTDPLRPWLEFDGIPQVPPAGGVPPDLPFVGSPSRAGDNLRFVSVDWYDITEECFAHVGQDPSYWADGLMGRLQARKLAHERQGGAPEETPLSWAIPVLEVLSNTVRTLVPLTRFKLPELAGLAFNDYLGDVQVYAEYSPCRGRAVRRFHDILAAVEHRHHQEFGDSAEARYTVIAHSLGTVMSLDALLFAHARSDAFDPTQAAGPGARLPGYLDPREVHALEAARGANHWDHPLEDEEIRDALSRAELKASFLDRSWVERVDAFVTLGSPIDKFLVIWGHNYEFLDDSAWIREGVRRPRAEDRIRHFNYSEEQDPVGHQLDCLKATPVYHELFHPVPGEDRVYVRCALPGIAHNSYWKDRDLFRWILRKAVDEQGPGAPEGPDPEIKWFRKRSFFLILVISYCVVPAVVITIDHFALNLALSSKSAVHAVLPMLGFVLTCWIGRKVLQLLVWWRRLLISKRIRSTAFQDLKREVGRKRHRLERGFFNLQVLLTLASYALAVTFGARYLNDEYPRYVEQKYGGDLVRKIPSFFESIALLFQRFEPLYAPLLLFTGAILIRWLFKVSGNEKKPQGKTPFQGDHWVPDVLACSVLAVLVLVTVTWFAVGYEVEPAPLETGEAGLDDAGEENFEGAFIPASLFFIASVVMTYSLALFGVVLRRMGREKNEG